MEITINKEFIIKLQEVNITITHVGLKKKLISTIFFFIIYYIWPFPILCFTFINTLFKLFHSSFSM